MSDSNIIPPPEASVASTATQPAAETSSKGTSKKTRSEVWDHFRLNDGKTVSICIYCSARLVSTGGGGTSSMWKHLKCCKKYPLNAADKKQKLLGSYSKPGVGGGTVGNWKYNEEHVRTMVARMVIIDEQPFSVVEHRGFRDVMAAAQPLYKNVSRFTVARDCVKLYISERAVLKNQLSLIKSRIALTTDIWTSIQNMSYLCLTGHFADEDWNLHKRLLSFVVMPSHKGKEIGKMVEKCIVDWGIRDHVSTITVDNASSNDTAVNYLKEKLKSVLVLDGDYFHMRCAAHILNLIVRDGLTEIRDSISRIRAAVRYVRSSPSRSQNFQQCIAEEKIEYKGSVCLDVSTRWNSTYLMLETALKFRKAFDRLEDDDIAFGNELDNGVPNTEDWDNASMMSLFLRNFYKTTKRVSGSQYVTCNHYFHEIVSMFSTLSKSESDSNPDLRAMARKMREKFNKYYGSAEKTNMMVLVAVVLDPRYKLRFVKYCCRRICGDEKAGDAMAGNVKKVLERLFEFYEKVLSSMLHEAAGTSTEVQSSASAMATDTYVDSDMVLNEWYKDDVDEEDSKANSELERYLSVLREPNRENFDVLKWWKDGKSTYKVLSLIAKDILAIPVSSVASESAFSTSGRVLDQFRSSLSCKSVEVLICAQDWLRESSNPITLEQYIEDAEKYEEELS